jgi:hypothetical protein
MKDLYEVLRLKENEFKRLGKEIEALRLTAAMLAEQQKGEQAATEAAKPGAKPAAGAAENGRGNWEEAPTRWP